MTYLDNLEEEDKFLKSLWLPKTPAHFQAIIELPKLSSSKEGLLFRRNRLNTIHGPNCLQGY